MARCIFSEFCRNSCTVRSSRILGLATRSGTGGGMSFFGRLLITHAILFLVPLLHFHGTWIYTCVSWRFSRFLWLHRLIIELQVDGVSRECEGFIIVVFTKAIFFFWIERGNLRKSVNRLFTCGMSLTMNLVQNYSDQFGNS